VFALLAIERGVPEQDTLLAVVVVTVALSVVLHGLTSAPLVRAYSRWFDERAMAHPTAAEAAPATMSRLRRQITPVDAGAAGIQKERTPS
jgi:NhaP-type Na+/H+ or K+/H+ antiporter